MPSGTCAGGKLPADGGEREFPADARTTRIISTALI